MSGKEGAVVRRRRHSGHQDGGEREGKDRERRLLFGVVKQPLARSTVPGALEENMGDGVQDGEVGLRAVGTVGADRLHLSGLGKAMKHSAGAGSAE